MTDITLIVAGCLLASGASLRWLRPDERTVSQALIMAGIATNLLRIISIQIVAPISEQNQATLETAVLVWVGVALFALAGRGLSRILTERRATAASEHP